MGIIVRKKDLLVVVLCLLANHELSTVFRYEEKEKRRKRHKSASTKSHKDSDSSDTETSPSSRSHTPGQYSFISDPDLVKKKVVFGTSYLGKYETDEIIIQIYRIFFYFLGSTVSIKLFKLIISLRMPY
jgi:hypothetical protein